MHELTREELEALVGNDGWLHEPPSECEHGFSPPRDCPNKGCPEQHLATAFWKLRAALSATPPERDE